jgi:hypothetical protein
MTTTSNLLEWTGKANAAGHTVKYSASGAGFDARVFTSPFGPIGWHATVKLANGETLMTDASGHRSSATCKAWATRVVNENS